MTQGLQGAFVGAQLGDIMAPSPGRSLLVLRRQSHCFSQGAPEFLRLHSCPISSSNLKKSPFYLFAGLSREIHIMGQVCAIGQVCGVRQVYSMRQVYVVGHVCGMGRHMVGQVCGMG